MLLIQRFAAVAVSAFALIFFASGTAYAATTVTLSLGQAATDYGGRIDATVRVIADVGTCGPPGVHGEVTLEVDGVTRPLPAGYWYSPYSGCSGGVYTLDIDTTVYDMPFGDHVIKAAYASEAGGPVTGRSDGHAVTVRPQLTAPVPGAGGLVKAGIMNPRPGSSMSWYCSSSSLAVDTAGKIAPPAGSHFPYGTLEYHATGCQWDCGFVCPPGMPIGPQQRVSIELPEPIPPGARFWVYATDNGLASMWMPVDARVDGSTATFTVTGGAHQGGLGGFIAMSPDVFQPLVQDMWWAGPGENGWGLSLSQIADRLFAGMYVYRDDGTPIWVVVSGGAWNDAHTAFTGDLYGPIGSWFASYDPSQLVIGPSLGKATFTFSSDRTATVEYTLGNVTGRKTIERLPFAGVDASEGRYAGQWYGGEARRGWGLAIGHRGVTMFSVWYTYDKQGNRTWFVMPGGAWTDATTYSGPLYRTNGSPWLGAAYDPARFVATPAGTMTLQFTDGDHGTMSYTVDGIKGSEALVRQPL